MRNSDRPTNSVINILSQLVGLQLSVIAGGIVGVISAELARQLLDIIADRVSGDDLLVEAITRGGAIRITWQHSGVIEVPIGEIELLFESIQSSHTSPSRFSRWTRRRPRTEPDPTNQLLSQLRVVLDNHTTLVLRVRGSYAIPSDIDILTVHAADCAQIPRRERLRIGTLQETMRTAISVSASRVETTRRKALSDNLERAAINRATLNPTKFGEVENLISADGKVRLSIQSFSMTMQAFSELNNRVIDELESAALPEGRRRLNLLLNAIIVYEVCEYAIRYYNDFRLAGVSEVRDIYEQQKINIELLRAKQIEHRRNIDARPDMDETLKSQLLLNIAAREQTFDFMMEKWSSYLESIDEVENNIGQLAQKIADIGLLRDDAELQILSLEAFTILDSLKHHLDLLHDALGVVADLRIITLSPHTLRLLFGF